MSVRAFTDVCFNLHQTGLMGLVIKKQTAWISEEDALTSTLPRRLFAAHADMQSRTEKYAKYLISVSPQHFYLISSIFLWIKSLGRRKIHFELQRPLKRKDKYI